MVDPFRKRNLARGAPVTIESSNSTAQDWIVRSYHATKAGSVDFSPLARSCASPVDRHSSRNLLLAPIIGVMRTHYAMATNSTIQAAFNALRSLWTFLDTLEGSLQVAALSDIEDIHGSLWIKSGADRTAYGIVHMLLQKARAEVGLPTLYWAPRPKLIAPTKDPPSLEWVRWIYHEMKDQVRAMLQRWSASDRLASEGRAQIHTQGTKGLHSQRWKEEDKHATFRAALARLGEPLGRPTDIRIAMGYSAGRDGLPRAWNAEHGDMLGTLYPTKLDVLACFHIFLLKTGWNPQVALDMDVSGDQWFQSHPTNQGMVILRSTKSRGGKGQQAICARKHTFAPFRLVEILIERTKPLRDWCRRELDRAEHNLSNDPANDALRAEVTYWAQAVRSPWLHLDGHRTHTVKFLRDRTYEGYGGRNYLHGTVQSAAARHASILVNRLGLDNDAKRVVLPEINATDLRDAFLDFNYVASGYSWFVAKVAAGHTTLKSLRNYLGRQRYRRHSETEMRKLQDALFREIGEKRLCDPAVLRALVLKGDITEEQRARWRASKGLTRMGMGCIDPFAPPFEIDPEHRSGTRCRIQRCILCSKGIVLEGSLDFLARRQAELEYIQSSQPLIAWSESSYPEELERLQATLAQFDADAVFKLKGAWVAKITSGQHRVVDFEGTYDYSK